MTQITFSAADTDPRDNYGLLTGLVVPRPIAWVSTKGADGSLNLAPFSYFAAAASHPPSLMVSVGQRGGGPKDTLRNLQETREMVVHLVDQELVDEMNLSSGDWAYGESEIEKAGLSTIESMSVVAPRIAEAKVAMECRVVELVPVAETRYTVAIAHVLQFHMEESLLIPGTKKPDPAKFQPVSRLGGSNYGMIGDMFSRSRPDVR